MPFKKEEKILFFEIEKWIDAIYKGPCKFAGCHIIKTLDGTTEHVGLHQIKHTPTDINQIYAEGF